MNNPERNRLRDELLRLSDEGFEDYVVITLISGENIYIKDRLQLVVGWHLVRVYPPDHGEITFPLTNVCSLEVA